MGNNMCLSSPSLWLLLGALLLLQASPAAAFGAGNIASISAIEGRNWRHGDIEDMLKTVAFIKGHKWTSMMVKRVYFGNWLRDYSQAVDVGTLKGVQSATIRILVWVLSFLSFGYATGEFEVTEERLGVYRPEEHIDNPKDYADNVDARQYDARLRGPVQPIELQVDPQTGMKNYIANENLGIANSAGYIKHSFARSIHFGRVYTNGAGGTRGKEADLCEALRCLGQGLHCLEDFGAHTNYTELALRELGYRNVFPHTGAATEIDLHGHRVFPLVTGTFGAVDFLHSVIGEVTDNLTASEVDEMNIALKNAEGAKPSGDGSRSALGGSGQASYLTGLLAQVPGAGGLCQQAEQLQAQSQAQERMNESGGNSGYYDVSRASNPGNTFPAFPGSEGGPPGPGVPGMGNFDPVATAAKIYPILEFRDRVVKMVSATIEKIPGLEALVEKITETVTLFVLSLLAPYIRPIIDAVSKQLKTGSSTVVNASGQHQYEPWTDPHCSDPTHSLLSKDHFSNILNEPAGQVATAILQYVAPRVLYAWEHPDISVDEVLHDVSRVFHHPAIRDPHCELHRNMYTVVEQWSRSRPGGSPDLNDILSAQSVREGKNHKGDDHQHGSGAHNHSSLPPLGNIFGAGSHSKVSGAPWEKLKKFGQSAGLTRDGMDVEEVAGSIGSAYPGTETAYDATRPPTGPTTGYQHEQQPPYQSSYPQNPSPAGPPPESYNPYGGQQGYQQGYDGAYAPQGYQGQPGGAPQYGYDPNAPPPQQPYGGPPQGNAEGYYGGGRY